MTDLLEQFFNKNSPETRAHLQKLGAGAVVSPAKFAREHRLYCHKKGGPSLNQRKLDCGYKTVLRAVKVGYFKEKKA